MAHSSSLPHYILAAQDEERLKYLRLLNPDKYRAIITLLNMALEDELARRPSMAQAQWPHPPAPRAAQG